MPPLWKIKRELKRIFWQLFYKWPKNFFWYSLATPYYDLVQSHKRKISKGQVALSRKVAIYLIFPENGVLPSHMAALDYLRENGYSTLVVSNLPIKPADRERLGTGCWRIIERPNIGYDFGGFRDGVLHISRKLADLDRLVLINDSTWFPIPGSKNWLKTAEATGLDYVGAVSNYGTPRPDYRKFRDIKWTYRTDHRNFHYCSFAISISPNILRSRGFVRYWRKFRMTGEKNVTVRRGEIGLTKWAMSNGFSHGSTLDVENLDADFRALTDQELFDLLQDLLIPEAPRMVKQKYQLLQQWGTEPRENIEKFILTVVVHQGAGYALPKFLIPKKGYTFLKKSPVWLDPDSSETTLKLAKQLDGEMGASIVAEITSIRKQRADRLNKKAKENVKNQ